MQPNGSVGQPNGSTGQRVPLKGACWFVTLSFFRYEEARGELSAARLKVSSLEELVGRSCGVARSGDREISLQL